MDRLFQETERDHAKRLGQTPRQVWIHRRILKYKREGLSNEAIQAKMNRSNCPDHALYRDIPALEAFLQVRWVNDRYLPNGYRAEGPALLTVLRQAVHSYGGDKEARARAGLHNGTPPYGYSEGASITVTHGGQTFTGRRLEIVTAQADVINEIFGLFVEGKAATAIARELHAQGLLTAAGKHWSEGAVRDIIRRAPFYAGYVVYRPDEYKNDRWRGALYPSRCHEPLFGWDTVADVLDVQGRDCLWEFED